MTEAPITDDIALRIALAARTLPDIAVGQLLRVIEDAIGLPPTADKLQQLKVKDIRSALDGEFAELDSAVLEEALQILKGEAAVNRLPPPAIDPESHQEMGASILVACASNGGELLDGHFGSARQFLVYQVSASEHRLIDVRRPEDSAGGDKNESRAHLIADCQIVYVASIGGPAAAKVIKLDIHPIKDASGGSARERIVALQRVLGDNAPPWLAKVMGRKPEQRVLVERDEDAQ